MEIAMSKPLTPPHTLPQTLPHTLPHTLSHTLQSVRKARRLSQLELSLRVGVSQRHVSFVESGRAKPSRALLTAWLQELEAPLALQNAAMLQAGYAPAYSAASLDDPALAQAKNALVQLLAAHDPMPAMILDAEWNVLHLNHGAQWLATTLVPWLTDALAESTSSGEAAKPLNMLDLMLHPDGICKRIVNLHEVAPTLLAHVRRDAAAHPALVPKAEALASIMKTRLGTNVATNAWTPPAAPVLTTRFATEHGELAFFSLFTTFGTPQDITLASLRVEHLFAADERTRSALRVAIRA
jgi:transcriptional regulator with XRE-family HTH domain